MILNENKKRNLKYLDALNKYKAKCKCGHIAIIYYRPFVICGWCGRKIYRSKKDEFLDKMKKVNK